MRRVFLIYIFFLAGFMLILLKLFYLQVLRHEEFFRTAKKQYLEEMLIPAKRGNIFDVKMNPIVLDQNAYLVYAEPQKIKDPKSFAVQTALILDIDEASISAKIQVPDLFWIPLARKVEQEKAAKLREAGIEGLGFEEESKRYYPEGSMSAHLLGFTAGSDEGVDKGYFGLEGFYEPILRGRAGFIRQYKDARGKPIIAVGVERREPLAGKDLILGIDKTIQTMVEDELKEGLDKYGAKGGTVAIVDPANGLILAMASYPSYYPGAYREYPPEYYKNPVAAESYEPGSTFKTLVMAAAINEKAIDPTMIYGEDGPISIAGYKIKTWNDKYSGSLSATDILVKSSNTGMVYISQKLTGSKMLKYIKDFGLGQPTGIDLEDETVPYLRPDKEWKEIDYATLSFGQGIAVTPIQMLSAVSVIAGGGEMIEPRVVWKIRSGKNEFTQTKTKIRRRVISPVSAKVITEMMVAAVDRGEAKFAKSKGYRIAGKTGTAQIPVSGHYDNEKTIASFVGFAPADEPKFVMLVTLREPSSSPWGSETAAPLFFDIAKNLFEYYKIPPGE